jgi:hypothetical protein
MLPPMFDGAVITVSEKSTKRGAVSVLPEGSPRFHKKIQ